MTKYVSSNAHGRPSVEFLTGGEYDAPTLELPRVAASAGYLAEWMLDRPVSDEAEAAAGTVSDFLRRLTEDTPTDEYDSPRARIEQNIGIGCPDWCQVNHAGPRLAVERAEGMRECSIGGEEIPTLTGQTISASVAQFTDLITGTRRQPEVRVGDDTLTPVNAIWLAGQIQDAAISALAPTLIGSEKPNGRCASWCVTDHDADRTDDGSELHESPVTTIDGFLDGNQAGRAFRANLRVESFKSGDSTWEEPPVVSLDIEPVDRPTVQAGASDVLSLEMVRGLADRILSGVECGQEVKLPPAAAIVLGRALVQYGEMARGA